MPVFTANKAFNKSLNDSICNAFGLPLESGEFEVKNYSFGNVVNIFIGEYVGTYDIAFTDNVYTFIKA